MRDIDADTTEAATPIVDWGALRELVSDDAAELGRRRRSVALTVAIVAWISAFVLVWICWDQVASRDIVADQLPFLASSGLAAIVSAIIGGAALVVAFLPTGSASSR
ncbi:hypothetical protein HC251_19645 [Iamia sp. SCSIO 61187]|uniref:hypothetical protein n=1 Tax=Iamia sp. SCSIO 61187 TaxID=2722752 RepID=UPI001C638563|nr:hypothetical protein [Iamia sp. SCSIO 61187]QYG94431.1 hypothetical protein HC251_19645 [Iamia sp. SCSIO 61187]